MRNGYVMQLDGRSAKGTMRKITVGDSAVGLGTLTERTGAVLAVVEGEIRMTYDGTDPVNTGGSEHGMPFYDGSVFDLNLNQATTVKFVSRVAGTPATLWVQDLAV